MSLDTPSAQASNGTAFRIAVAAARFNGELADGLLARTLAGLRAAGVKDENVAIVRVPGSHEVPVAVALLADKVKPDCIIGLGVLIGGDTNHHAMVGQSVSQALQSLAVQTSIPVINGVIVANTRAQAVARCLGQINRGAEFAQAALEMAELKTLFSR